MKALLQRPYAARGQYTKAKQWRALIGTFCTKERLQPPTTTVVDSTESLEATCVHADSTPPQEVWKAHWLNRDPPEDAPARMPTPTVSAVPKRDVPSQLQEDTGEKPTLDKVGIVDRPEALPRRVEAAEPLPLFFGRVDVPTWA